MKNLLKGLAVLFAMSFVMVGCGDDDLCTTCELAGASVEVCPDDIDALTATYGGTTVAEVITAIEGQGGSCN